VSAASMPMLPMLGIVQVNKLQCCVGAPFSLTDSSHRFSYSTMQWFHEILNNKQH
jgi:hypothetical protein